MSLSNDGGAPRISLISMGPNGQARRVTKAKGFQLSSCGEEFDDYIFQAIKQPFPFSPVGASSRDLPELWRNRRLKLHYHGKWREGQVVEFRQYNPTPTTMETCWEMEVELDTVEPGDQVEFKVVGTVKRNIRTRANEDGAVQITMKSDGGDATEITIKPSDSQGANLAPRIKLHVHRLNVQGGGTVRFSRENENEPLLSLEWPGPASPSVNLFENILTFDCPCCRAAEPVMTAYKTATSTTTASCPICMEPKECRALTCGHGVCEDCWNSCRLAATRISLGLENALGDLNEAEVKKERAKRDRLFNKKRNRDDGPRNTFMTTFDELVEDIKTISGLKRLRWEIMVENPALWAVDEVCRRFAELPNEALQVILQTVETRKDDIPIDQRSDAAFFCCHCIASRLRAKKDFREAVPWAELAMFYAIQAHENTTDGRNLPSNYLFLSQTHAMADMFTQSLEDFEKLSALMNSNSERENEARAMLSAFMKDWTGTSGKLTPGV